MAMMPGWLTAPCGGRCGRCAVLLCPCAKTCKISLDSGKIVAVAVEVSAAIILVLFPMLRSRLLASVGLLLGQELRAPCDVHSG